MKKLMSVVIIGVLCLTVMHANAFDGGRKGFQVGGGIGVGSAKVDDDSYTGLASTFKLGGGITDQISLHYCNRVVFFKDDGVEDWWALGLSSLALTYYLTPDAPSLYLTGEAGVTSLIDLTEHESFESAFGFSVGVGYEFASHYAIEANYMAGQVEISGKDEDVSSITLSLTATAF